MITSVRMMTQVEVARWIPVDDHAGFGGLSCARGHLPLKAMDVQARVSGLLCHTVVRQTFVNVYEEPLETTYIFPLPDRAAVNAFRMEVNGRIIEGQLKERGEARADYAQAIQQGRRAAITEEERPGVFTMRAGNLMPGESATVVLTLVGPLPCSNGEATFRFPLVVAPRYIPGRALPGNDVGDGVAHDTDAVPDASRITPPTLLPGYPNPVRLTVGVDLDSLNLPVSDVACSLHASVAQVDSGRITRISLQPGERLDRDFIVRFVVGGSTLHNQLLLAPDADGGQGTFSLMLVPPAGLAAGSTPRDIVFLLDRSGSMKGWKMVTARRAVARMVDTLRAQDRFSVYAWDDVVEAPSAFRGYGLVEATDRNRFRAVEFLAGVDARNGTEMYGPMELASRQLAHGGPERQRLVVLITDGQVGNESQMVKLVGGALKGTRVFTLGIDQAVNAGLLQRLAQMSGGQCELVETEDRLDAVMAHVHQSIDNPLLSDLLLGGEDITLDMATVTPSRLPDVFPGTPAVIMGRYRGGAGGCVTLTARSADGGRFMETVRGEVSLQPGLHAAWARGHIRDLEDQYEVGHNRGSLEKRILDTSLRFGVMCRFTSFVAVDREEVVNRGGHNHHVVQPVEAPAGWQGQASGAPASNAPLRRMASAVAPSPMPTGGVAMKPAPAPARAGAPMPAKAEAVSERARMVAARPPPAPPAASFAEAPEADEMSLEMDSGRAFEEDLAEDAPMDAPTLRDEAMAKKKDAALDPRSRLQAAMQELRRHETSGHHARLAALGTFLAVLQEVLAVLQHDPAFSAHKRPFEQLRDQLRALMTSGTQDRGAVDGGWAEALRVVDAWLNPAAPQDPARTRSFWR